LIFCMSVI